MAKDDIWFKFFYKLFLISTQGWKDDEVGAYMRLLINQFDRGSLPDDPKELQKLITTYKKNWPLLSKKFVKGQDGFLRNIFMDEIRIERTEKSKKGRIAGELGGRPSNKQKVNENKPKGYQNKTHIYSSSVSSSNSQEVGESVKGDETIELSPEGFFSDSLDPDLLLTNIQVGATVEYIRIKCKHDISMADVRDQWRAFKIQVFAQHDWYNNFEKLLAHFRDSLKIETKRNGTHKQHTAKSAGKSAGANQLLGILATELASYATEGPQDTGTEV
jgi:hypothetical protein